jgi:Protein of unknown function (DUF3175)
MPHGQIRQEMVRRGHRPRSSLRSRSRLVRQRHGAADRRRAEEIGAGSRAPQRRSLSHGDVDADFYVNRAGDKLSIEQRAKLDQAKMALRQSFGR